MALIAIPLAGPLVAALAAGTGSFNRDSVTPGPAGFIATGILGLAVILLVADMLRRIRRVHHRAEAEAALDAEQAAAAQAANGTAALDGSRGAAKAAAAANPAGPAQAGQQAPPDGPKRRR